jgi:hypothetical protein
MVPGSIGLTDEELSALEAQQGQPEITTGLVDRLAASPAPAQGFTDRQLDALPVLASTPFARERGIALPPEAPAEPEPMTDYELNQLEEENYRRVDYIMPQEEFRQYWTRRTEENNEVGRFIEGVGQGAAGMLAMIPEAGREIRDGMVGMVTDPVNQVQRNVQTGAETIRKAGINMVQLFDWVGNKVDDATTWAKRRGLKHQALAKRLEQEGKLTGDELQDANIIAAAASEADAMEPTPVENEEDFDKAYDRYQREKSLEQEFAGVTDFQVGASKMAAPATSKEAYQITNEQPAETLSMIGSMALDPVNLVPLGAGALSKLRVLRRTATLAGAPLRGVQRAADATADLAERMEFGISSRVQDITGLTAKQQAALGAGAAGAAVYADAAGGGGNVTAAVTALGSVLPGLRYGGAIIRKTGAAAGGAATIIREAGVGGIGTARAEAAADLARMTAIPERYRKYFTGYVDGTDSTLKRVAQDAGNPEALRRVARFADRAGVTTAARLADDVTSGAVAAGITGAPFAALQPDAERAGEVFGGIMALGGAGGLVGGAIGRRSTAPDADVARMMADVYAVGGNVDALSVLPHASLDRMAAMQGVLAGKVDFVPLKADEYRMNKDVSATSGELAAGLFLEKDANGRARVFINLDARKSAGGVGAIVPHEIGHAILTSNILDGQPRNDLRNLVNQQYGADGVQARGREYVGRLVDGDIQNGTTGELPQVLTEQEFRDLESGNKSPSDIAKGRKLEPSERERLINERYEELSQRSIERGEDALDWARDEVIAETFASEAPAIDFRGIRRDGAFPRLAESMLAAGGRVLEVMGVRLDGGTGKMLDNPSVLFRDNPLFQDRIMQKRVKEYVRAYDQYLVGLEEAGSATPRGVELARSSRPEDMARSTHVKLRDEGRGVLENDFLFQKPDGTYAYKPQPIINAAEANRAAQIKTLYDAKKFVPVNSTEFGKRKVNGREVIGGPVLPPQFDLFTQFPQHVRQFARGMEASRAEGGSWNIDYNAIGTGSSGRYRITNMGAVRAIQRETVPFGWQVTKQNHLLAASLDLNAFRASAMRAINKGELGIFNNDMKQVEADLKTYLANHRNGRPGEMTIGQQKRDTLNGLIGTGTAVQRAANPLYAELNPRGSIRTWRIDRLNDAQPSGRTGYFFDYDKINNNRMPQQIPRGAQGMPDAPVSGRGDGMSERWDAYTESLLDDVESWANARDTGRIDYDMQDVVQSFVDFARKNSQLAGDDLAKAFYRAEKPTASQRKKLNAALENVGQPPRAAAPRAQAMPDSLESVPTDQLLRQYEENQGYLGLSTLGMREGRPVRGGAAQTRELLRRNEAISAELERRGVRSEDAQLQRALQRRGQAMPDAAPAGDQGVAMPKGTVTQLTDTARKAIPRLPKGASSVPKLVIRRKDKPDAVVDGGNPKSWKDYTGQHWMPLPNVKLDKVKGVSFSKQDIYDVARTDRARAQADAQQSVRAAALAAADPMKFVDPVGYSEIMRASGVVGDILIPPSGLKLMLTDPAAFVGLLDGGFHGKRTVPGTRAAAMQGLDGVTDMRQLVGGQPSPFNTALHHYWGTLSKQLDVVNQEAAWMRTVLDPAIIEAIDMSVQGKFNMTPKAWEALVAKALDGTKGDFRGKGNNAKANANSFYKALAYHNGRWDEVAALYANNNAIDMRAQFNALGHGKVGMKNKVQGFVGLSFGVKGSVLDRWRFVDLYLPDVMKLTGAATPEQYFKYVGAQKVIPQDPIGIYKNYGTLENGNPAFSLALYNSLDSVAQVAINNSPELRNYLGAHADPGGLHWATWNAIKNEAVGHSSLDITKNFVRKYGRNGTASDFAQFMRTAEGFVEGSNDAGQTIRLSLKNGAFNYLEQ